MFRNILQHTSTTSSSFGPDHEPQITSPSNSAPLRTRRTGFWNLEVAAHGTSGRRGSLDGICEEGEENEKQCGESRRYSNGEKTILEQISEDVVTEESELEDED